MKTLVTLNPELKNLDPHPTHTRVRLAEILFKKAYLNDLNTHKKGIIQKTLAEIGEILC